MLVRSQLSRMPGEERKFKRRRIVALLPTCKRERELAASHTSIVAGIAAIGVAVNSLTGVTVGEGRGARVVAEVLAGGGVFVPTLYLSCKFSCLFDQICGGDASGVAEPRLQFFGRELNEVCKRINPRIVQSLFEGRPDAVD
jgi:hypothetical protein